MRLVAERCHDLDLLAAWPATQPVLALLGNGRYAVVATAFSEVRFGDTLGFRWPPPGPNSREAVAGQEVPPFGAGIVGLVAYDDGAPSRTFRVQQALVLDRQRRTLWLGGADPASAASATFVLPSDELATLIRRCQHGAPPGPPPEAAAALSLHAMESDASYLEKARSVLEDIRSGRYYQLNLLRFFEVAGAPPERAWIFARMASHGGAFAAFVDLPDGLSLASFSPERFVSVDGDTIETYPVKGTAPRHTDPARDRAAAAALLASPKDRAELAMIVDLMRNDIAGVALPGTISVPETCVLSSHANVHHLSASVRARMRPGTTLAAVLAAVCPGGSITGAPKIEVMKAIRQLEGRSRGYFMGNLFYLSDDGYFDSSILIRTLVRRQDAAPYVLAAGSGLVVHSDPELERAEIAAKARVVGSIVK